MDLWILLGDIVVLLTGALLLGGLFSRWGQSPLIGYLLAGMLLGGPGSLGAVGSAGEIEAIAELGVALLLYSLGLEFSLKRLRKLGSKPLVGGMIQVLLTMLCGAVAASLWGLPIRQALAFGGMIALSSTAVVLRMLMERSELDMPHGRNSLGVLLTQDMAVVPLALLITVLGGEGDGVAVAQEVGKLLLVAIALVGGMWVLNKVAVAALGTLTLDQNRELAVIFAVATGLGAAWVSHAAGISPALGAFVAGMLLGSSAFATQIRADVSSFRVVLLTLFFGAAGMVADPWWIMRHAHLVILVTLAITLGKVLILWAIFQLLGHTLRVALSTGFCLAQIGEFAFVLGTIGRTAGVVSTDLYALIVSVTITSFLVSAFLVPRATAVSDWIATKLGHQSPERTQRERRFVPELVIVGFGPSAQRAVGPLLDTNTRVLVIDLNHEGVARAQECGFRGLVGDATQGDVLEHAHVGKASAVMITVPHPESGLLIMEQVRLLAPNARVVVRSRYQIHTEDFVTGGGHVVVGDEEEVGDAMGEAIREWLQHDQ